MGCLIECDLARLQAEKVGINLNGEGDHAY